MNIGIIVYSYTGHTLTVATTLEQQLSAAGHEVSLEQVEIVGADELGATGVELKTRPEVDAYDAIAFGSPVRGGAMPPAMTSYLEQVPSLESKDVVCLVTHFFPPGIGANQTLDQMVELCESKGADVRGSAHVGWPRLGQKRRIAGAVETLRRLLAEEAH